MNSLNLPLTEYPRPQFKRDSYIALNGFWDYAITQSEDMPGSFDGKILVPYSPESKLSGVEKQLKAAFFLHYRRFFTLPDGFNRGRVLINFGAVDQECAVYVNGRAVVSHKGGYTPFSADITSALTDGENCLWVSVRDDASSPDFGRGKQKYKRDGIWYTAVSGIWQSVWLESVPSSYIENVRITPDFYKKTVSLSFKTLGKGTVRAEFIDDGGNLICGESDSGQMVLNAENCTPWTTDNPKLYALKLIFGRDEVESYFGLRSFSTVKIKGKVYTTLNGAPIFHNGLLDQGYYLDGIYTPASWQEVENEIISVKKAGFNMLRKHAKVEPLLWYHYCDKHGILVWQDMVNGGERYKLTRIALAPFFNLRLDDGNYKSMGRSAASRAQYITETEQTVNALYNCVSLCLWTPFNEAWGQFDALKIEKFVRSLDDTRLIDHASGWQDMGGGDLDSHHVYFRRIKLNNDGKRALSLTEFGGYSLAVNGHVFTKKRFGYKGFKSLDRLEEAYESLYLKQVVPAVKSDGLCATVYTQLTDVEDEINGLFTYDRVQKISTEKLKMINGEVYRAFEESLK